MSHVSDSSGPVGNGKCCVGDILHSTEDFQVEIAILSLVPRGLKGLPGYAIRNMRTGLIEQEGNSEGDAIRALLVNQDIMDRAKADPSLLTPQSKPMTLDEMIGLKDYEDEDAPA